MRTWNHQSKSRCWTRNWSLKSQEKRAIPVSEAKGILKFSTAHNYIHYYFCQNYYFVFNQVDHLYLQVLFEWRPKVCLFKNSTIFIGCTHFFTFSSPHSVLVYGYDLNQQPDEVSVSGLDCSELAHSWAGCTQDMISSKILHRQRSDKLCNLLWWVKPPALHLSIADKLARKGRP